MFSRMMGKKQKQTDNLQQDVMQTVNEDSGIFKTQRKKNKIMMLSNSKCICSVATTQGQLHKTVIHVIPVSV